MKVKNKTDRQIWKNPNVKDLTYMGVVRNPKIVGLEESGLQSINEEGGLEYADESAVLH